MALDYISQIQEIQAQGPYRLLGYSFGGKVAHAMAAHLEKLGERVDMLAIMDTIPNDNPLMSNGQSPETSDLLLGYNVDETPELMRVFLERASVVKSWNDSLSRSHSPPTFGGNMVLFRANEQNESISCATAWKPYVLGEIEEFDIRCNHDDMDKPVALAEIGGTLAWKLDELHMHETKED
jgi:thioesterase domain-containing protein